MRAPFLISAPLLLLAACDSGQPVAQPETVNEVARPAADAAAANTASQPAQSAPALAIEAEGLRLFVPPAAARPIAFGVSQQAVLDALAYRGPHETNRLEECGAGPLDTASWPDGLTLYFQDSSFVGWAAGSAGEGKSGKIATAAGIGPGSTRGELEAAYSAKVEESTLGTEFAAGGLFGVLDGTGRDSKVEVMWAGTSCNFR